MRTVRRTSALLGCAMVMAASVVSGGVALADEPVESPEVSIDLDSIDAVEPALPTVAAADGFESVTADRSVVIPDDASGAVEIESEAGVLGIGIPGDADAAATADGIAYEAVAPESDITVRPTAEGVQVLIAIDGTTAPDSFSFPIEVPEGASLQAQEDGSISIISESVATDDVPGVVVEMGSIAPAWAIDANGDQVPTSYVIEGDVVTQIVDHTDAAYPVVADPSVSFGRYIYVKYNKTDVRRITSGIAGGTLSKVKYAAIVCVAIPNPAAAAACGFYVYDSYSSVNATFRSAKAQNRCVELKYWLTPPHPLVGWKTYSC